MTIDYGAALREQNRLFGTTIRGTDMATPVPTCPGWSLLQLLRHLGRACRWTAQIIRERADGTLDPRAVPNGRPPDDEPGALAWLHESAQVLLDAVAASNADAPVWTWNGPRPAAWWLRRMLHEHTVHRADAAIALNVEYLLAPELGADALSELFGQIAIAGWHPLDTGTSLHLHATDIDADWTLRPTATGLAWEPSHTEATTALRGPAASLLLVTTRRHTAEEAGVEVFGDPKVFHTWLERTPYQAPE